jgi:hypothetical protein
MYSPDAGFARAWLRTWRTWLPLAALLTVGFSLRLFYLLLAVRTPGFRWEDPDGYLAHALMLARPDGWHWSFDVAKYASNGQVFALPPLYAIFLSLIALFPGLPFSAQLAQIVLSTMAIGLIFVLGRILHSSAAGLWASAAYALSVSSIFGVWSTSQEALYIPILLLAFLLYARALDRDARPLSFGVAGAVMGLAALTRSMPLFFVLPLAALHVAMATDRRVALHQSIGYLAGFALIVGPYCVGLSRSFGQLTLIDSHSGIRVEADSSAQSAPGLADTAAALWRLIAAHPLTFLQQAAERARALFYVNGGRQLQIYVVADTRIGAVVWKLLVHLGTDAILIAAAVLAWPGAVLCRNTRLAVVFLSWAALNIAIVGLSGFGGARLRTPFEPFLLLLGVVVLAGRWRPRPRPALAVVAAFAVAMAVLVLPQLPRSLASWPDYGVQWPSVLNRTVGSIHGSAGFNVPAYDGVGRFLVQPAGDGQAIQVDVRAGGTTVQSIRLNHEPTNVTFPWPRRGLAFAELRAVDPNTERPASVRVEVGRR